uniref:Rhodanese domain-containing protein n=1 Tax=Panagrellus redivivus TaxID=6233 RepID=A0A7E4ZVE2_PANRE
MDLKYSDHPFSNEEIDRYSRQIITANFDVNAQTKLHNSSVLIVGCGGLGNPVALYLSTAGIGKIGLVDHDKIELSNLHRQIGFTVADIGRPKVEVLKDAILARNPSITVEVHETYINKDNVLDIMKGYSIVADCSDNLPTRYLLNEACILEKTPLAMGSAVSWSGQFSLYHVTPNSACYRCIFPRLNQATMNLNCNEKGIMGPVVGIIGNLQALEIVKFLALGKSSFAGSMYNYDGYTGRVFDVTLRSQTPDCPSCHDLKALNDYEVLCKNQVYSPLINDCCHPQDRMTVTELKEALKTDKDNILFVDVRPAHEFAIAHHPLATNIPITDFENSHETPTLSVKQWCQRNRPYNRCIFICRRGNDSQRVVMLLKSFFLSTLEVDGFKLPIKDVIGGYEAWRSEIDPKFPTY